MEDKNIYSPPSAELSDPSQAQQSFEDLNLASRWARLGASLIDVVILIAVYVSVFYGTDYWDRAIKQDISFYEQILSLLIGFAVYLIFNGYLLHKRGQTIGKWALGIKIIAIRNNKILPLWKVFFVRYVPQVLIALIPIAGNLLILIDDLFIFGKDKRCVHDLIAGTQVIREYAH